MIPGDHEHGRSGVRERGERAEHAHVAARHHGAPLEPEVEEVAVDHDGAGVRSREIQKRDDVALALGGSGAQVRVGHQHAWRGKHAHILVARGVHYKPALRGAR